jgi:hypothetical protein
MSVVEIGIYDFPRFYIPKKHTNIQKTNEKTLICSLL